MSEARAHTNPFPGLRPFETNEYRLFFGREGQSDALIERLQRSRFLAVVGTSGSGKSSLVRAGLLPALRGGMMAGAGAGWRVAVMRPGHDPISNLAHEIVKEGVLAELGAGLPGAEAEAIVEATLRRGSLGLVDAVRQARLGAREKLLVVVDQFEELFRFRAARAATDTDDDASAFVKLLLEAKQADTPTEERLPIYVVLTMRSDFLGDCAQFQGLPEAINDGQYLIPRMTRDERRFAIVGPVRVARGKITEPLVNRLLNEVGDNPDQLPLLQHALMRTWDYWQGHRRAAEPIGIEHYEAVGTMSDALSHHADEAFNELPDERSRHIAEVLFKALTERGADNREIRRPTSLSLVCLIAGASEAEVVSVIDVFRREGRSFLMPPAGVEVASETVVDISHESLIRNWERLREWVKDEAESARIYRRLAGAAMDYREGAGGLLDDVTLQFVLKWKEKNDPTSAWGVRYHPEHDAGLAYLEESRIARDAALAARDAQRKEQEAAKQRELELAKKNAEDQRRFAEDQRRAAQRLRRVAVAMFVTLLLALASTAVAAYALKTAREEKANAEKSAVVATDARTKAQISAQDARGSEARLKLEKERADEIALGLIEEKKKTDDALVAQKQATERANEQARIAAQREQEARRASEQARLAAIAARKAKDEAIAARDEANRQRDRLEVDALGRLGLDSFQRGNYAGAEYAFQMALGMIGEKGFGDGSDIKDRDLAKSQGWVLANIGSAQRKLGNYANAVKSYQKALAIHEKVTPAASGEMFDTIHGLGHAYNDAGEEYKANETYTRAVELLVKNPTIIDSIFELPNLEIIARLYRDLGRYDEAQPYFERVLTLRRERKNENEIADALKEIAQFYAAQNKWREAEALYSELLSVQERDFTSDKFANVDFRALADSYSDLGEIYSGLGDEPKVKSIFQLASALQGFALKLRRAQRMEATGDPGNDAKLEESFAGLKMDESLKRLGDLFVNVGRYRPAEIAYKQALALQVASKKSPAEIYMKLGSLYRFHLKEYDKALVNYRGAKAVLSSNQQGSSALLGKALTQIGELYAEELKNPAEARALLMEALSYLGLLQDSEKAQYAALSALAGTYRRENITGEFVRVSRRKLSVAQKLLRRTSPNTVEQKAWNADAYGAYAEAFGLYIRAVADLSEAFSAQGNAEAAKAAYGTLLEEELDVSQVVDENVLDAYADMLETHSDYLSRIVRPPSAMGSVAERIKEARMKQSQIEQISRQQQIRQQTYAPAKSP
ncbi:MAG: tetratricopeptide repeat protein [Rubrivivax sp.]|nr:tetratricopeptide repeat protein [Pyrinomonadaceae bacterium]